MRIFKQSDLDAYSIEWMRGLNASGYAGIKRNGNIVDRREFNDAVPIQKNPLFGIVEPAKITE